MIEYATFMIKLSFKILFAISLMIIGFVMTSCASASKSAKPDPESGQQVETDKSTETKN